MANKTLQRSTKAFDKKRASEDLYEDIYELILPYRRTKTGENGKPRTSHLYDSTAVQSAFRFAGRMQSEVTPVDEDWFVIQEGPLFPEDKIKELRRSLEHDNKIFRIALNTGEFHTASMESYLDLGAGTSVLFVLEADEDDELVNYISAPYSEVAIECNAKGHVCGVFWEKKYSASEIYMGWPKLQGRMSPQIKKGHTDGAKTKSHKVTQAITYFPNAAQRSRRWRYELIVDEESRALLTSWSEYSPAIVTRFFRLPGEDEGRGPFMIALPNVRTANKTMELILQAAALSLFGMFTATDDGILNPDKFQIEPGGIVYVESNASGAYGGRSLEKLDMAGNVNLTDIVLQDQRQQIKSSMMDDQLPPQAGSVRSPTEIVARQRNQSFDISTAYGRLRSEYGLKLVQRVGEILNKNRLITPDLRIDQKMIMCKFIGPMSRAQNMGKIEAMVQALEVALGVGGMEMTALVFKVEEIILEVGTLMGMPPAMIRDKIDQEKLLELVGQIVAQSQEKADAAGAPGPIDEAMGGGLG